MDQVTEPTECNESNQGRCDCGDVSNGFTTYTFWINDVQRCFTVYHPVSRSTEKLPVVLFMNCYAKDQLGKLAMSSVGHSENIAAERYGYIRIGLSTPEGNWQFGNNGIVNDDNPMPCSDEDSKDIPYLKKIFAFIEENSDIFNKEQIYTTGFSQNSMFAAYTGFCFNDMVIGVWQGGSGMALTGKKPYLPQYEGQCTKTSFQTYGGECVTSDPCTECQYWPIYPCYDQDRPMVDCVAEYTNDGISVQDGSSSAVYMYEALSDEGHDVRLLRFDPSEDNTISGGHTNLKNELYWQVGCLGITPPCSEACEAAFVSCVASRDVSTAARQASSFAECIAEPYFSETLGQSGCTAGCAPTYNMLIESETPAEVIFSNFGDETGESESRPDTSLCIST